MAISITKPVVNGSNNTWGDTINTALDTIVDAVNGTSGEVAPDLSEGSWKIGGTAVTTTGAELNVLDGDTAAISTTVVGTDSIVMNDDGVMKQVSMSDISTYIGGSTGNGTITVTAGNALTGGGSFTVNQSGNSTITVNHEDTSSQSSVNNSGNTFIQDITVDTYGHITALTSATASTGVSTTAGSVAQSSSSQTVSTGVASARVLYWQDGSTSSNAQRIRTTTTNSSGNFTADVPYSLTIYWITWK